MSSAHNILEALREASSFLAALKISEPDSNARLLLGHILNLSPASLLASFRDPFPDERRKAWEEAISRKAAGEPAQYIIGEQEFYGLAFRVSPAVLIPRPETELLVERIAELGEEIWPGGSPSVWDIGTGSGAIAGALKSLRPAWKVAASDISPDALAQAKENMTRLGLDVEFRQGNLLEPFEGETSDILVSNPPYIPARTVDELQPEVRDYEPRSALDGGADGLDPYRIMMDQLTLLAGVPRLIGFELGLGQADEVAEMLRTAGHWSQIEIVNDYAGIKRHVIGYSK